ncbi:class A beta-lactamase [Mycobacterium sp. ACS1612]|uniref:class A beta-lactamase n=1 Tax=Mycobacterium sp. ACS1612 TaxID=1834117 RepID=UPI0007FDE4EA|nr:class A beta-lactamase [Mycobacterium sp. ACS1612]OBF36662.1 class A beta-lactamase [Mycobacterium sp. ACS1612]
MTGLSRRSALLGGLALAAAAASTPKSALAQPPVADRIAALERRHNAYIGVFAVDLGGGRSFSHRGQQPFAMCSTFKAYAAGRVLQMVEQGQLTLDQQVFVDPAGVVANSPRTEPRAGGNMTLDELCQAALQVSDNTAGNLLLNTIGGPPAVTAFARSIGDQGSRLDRWETELNSAVPGDPRDTSTPEALGGGYRALLTGDALAPAQRQQLEDWMRANETSSMRAGLPQGWTSADKTGSGDYGTANDVGVAYGPEGQLLLAVMTRSQLSDPHAASLRPMIGEVTALLIPELLA